jgi:hypothetical protein
VECHEGPDLGDADEQRLVGGGQCHVEMLQRWRCVTLLLWQHLEHSGVGLRGLLRCLVAWFEASVFGLYNEAWTRGKRRSNEGAHTTR